MSYKDLLVHLDSSKHCAARIDLAVALAETHKAHLTGLYVAPHAGMSPLIADQFAPDVIEDVAAQVAQQRDKAEALFGQSTAKIKSQAEWLEAVSDDPATMVATHAREADLCVLTQTDPDEVSQATPGDLPERVVMESGRPALILPYVGGFKPTVECAVIAWNASPQVARAVNDALPLLRRAKRVVVLAIQGSGAKALEDIQTGGIVRHLARHGVEAEEHTAVSGDMDVSEVMLSRVADESADLVVMGAYGHSRLREFVLGGMSRRMFDHMTVPILVSH